MARNGRRSKLVPESYKGLEALKYEVAGELGVAFGQPMHSAGGDDTEFAGDLGAFSAAGGGGQYLGNLTSREAGAVGGGVTKKLIQQAQKSLL